MSISICIGLTAMCLIYEVLNYYLHRSILHSPLLYKRIHSVHHEILSTDTGWNAFYTHPLEALGNIICFSLPFLITNYFLDYDTIQAVIIAIVWTLFYILGSLYTHSTMANQGYHAQHHIHVTKNYSSFGLMDYLMGTSLVMKKKNSLID